MTEEEIKLEAEKKAADEAIRKEAFDKAQAVLKEKSVEDLVSIINDTRSEARDRRLKEKELEAELEKIKADDKAKADAKLAEDGKFQELINSQKTEIESYKIKADEMSEFKKTKVASAKAKHGDKWREEYNNLSLTAIDALDRSLSDSKPAINTDGGATGEHVEIELTAEQKKDAKAMYAFAPEKEAFEMHKHNLIKTGKIKVKE